MKQGRDLVALATELQRVSAAKQDFVVDSRSIRVRSEAFGSDRGVLEVGTNALVIQPLAHRQIAEKVGVPQRYYDRMLADARELWASNVNHWFTAEPGRHMVRSLDGGARALLSDRYRRLDNEDVAGAALPVLLESPDIQVVSCELTETRLYLKAIFPKVEAEVRKGDVVQAGVVISNSEVGLGALSVTPLIYRLVCTNGMVRADEAWRKLHIGQMVGADSSGLALRGETVMAQDKAIALTLQDAIRGASAEAFRRSVLRMQEAAESTRIERPIAAIEVLQKKLPLTKGEGESILERLIRDQDYTRYGVMNAVTNLANTVPDYDRASELECLGGRLLDLPANDWRQIAEAA